jgi:hypothetical protein
MNKLLTALCAFAFAATAYAQGTAPATPAKPADSMKATAPVTAEAAKPVATETAKPAAEPTAKKSKHKSKKKKAKPSTSATPATPAAATDKPAK